MSHIISIFLKDFSKNILCALAFLDIETDAFLEKSHFKFLGLDSDCQVNCAY